MRVVKSGAGTMLSSLASVNLHTVMLGIRKRSALITYVSGCVRKYDELVGNGLPLALPNLNLPPDATVTIPALDAGGGMSQRELVVLSQIAKAFGSGTIFEIGTYNGLTASVFILNAAPDSAIFTLDLPESLEDVPDAVHSDQELISSRRLGWVPGLLGLQHRYTQLLCDSLLFDPASYLDSIGLGLIDGAHDLVHVQNDTIKMAKMIKSDGIVVWHDYGGKGRFRSLTKYLNDLGRRGELYRIPDTLLAWARGSELKKAVSLLRDDGRPAGIAVEGNI